MTLRDYFIVFGFGSLLLVSKHGLHLPCDRTDSLALAATLAIVDGPLARHAVAIEDLAPLKFAVTPKRFPVAVVDEGSELDLGHGWGPREGEKFWG